MSHTDNPQPRPKNTTRRWLILAVKILILALLIWAVHRTLLEAWQQARGYPWSFRPSWLITSGLLYLLGLLAAGLFWRYVLRQLGQDPRLAETLRAYYIGHLGKYVPGKAMVVVLRAGLIRSRRVDTGVAAASVFLETLTMMAVGACLAGAVLAIGFRDNHLLLASAVVIAIAAGVPTLPPVFRRLAILAKIGKSDPSVRDKLGNLGYTPLLWGWLSMTLLWGMLGLSLWATLRGMGIEGLDPIGQLPRFTACVALATVAGFVLLLLPGGIGVRELVLIELLKPYLAEIHGEESAALMAVASAAVLRLVWLVSELIISGILYVVGRP